MKKGMKRLFIIATLVALGVFIFASVYAQIWHTANQVTIEWDAVTTNTNGTSLTTGDIVKYKVYIKNAVTGGEPIELEEVTSTEYTVTLNTEGSYFLGVKALRYNSEEEVISESTISWSDIPEACFEGKNFGVRYFLPPSNPLGLRKK